MIWMAYKAKCCFRWSVHQHVNQLAQMETNTWLVVPSRNRKGVVTESRDQICEFQYTLLCNFCMLYFISYVQIFSYLFINFTKKIDSQKVANIPQDFT